MSGDLGTRRLLPQSSQMQSFSFAPNNFGPRENQKNYVFVDEHNRHKRLKVMRACEGCRRRKIKCDAATTNTWPCSACIRLKLHCVPPTVTYDRDFQPNNQSFEGERVGYDGGAGTQEEYHQQVPIQQHLVGPGPSKNVPPIYTQQPPYGDPNNVYQTVQYGGSSSAHSQQSMHYNSLATPVSALDQHQQYSPQSVYPAAPIHPQTHDSPESFGGEDPYGQNIADLLGELKMSETGTDEAPYLSSKSKGKSLAEEPAFEEFDEYKLVLPPTLSEHADSFMDVPRLSTLQANLIILKARESAPKRGYYYRSWMTVVACVQMAKDLGLDEHYEEHKAGRPCGADLADCITKTRIWQTIFVCELMIGSPQGRTDLSVDMETLDLSIPRTGLDNSELNITRNFTWLTRVVRNVRRMNNVYARIKKKKEWGIDPDFVQLNPSFETWMNDLPGDLQIDFPADGSPPWLPTHFIGNLHSYYYLSIIMLHRPQLTFMDSQVVDGEWKHHMLICYSSAKYLCRLQEAILQSFGLTGLLCMQRGINFTIYCVLTCAVLHLVAITSPDPDLNSDAREYFTRHMRILEKCTNSWPMPDMQQKIESLRLAFSADIRKPFVLKPSFPYGSPVANTSPQQPHGQHYRQSISHPTSVDQQNLEHQNAQQRSVSYTSHPISPPISAGGVDTKSDSPAVQSLVMMATGQRASVSIPSGVTMADHSTWNPTRIFDQWNSTFGTPPTSSSSASQTTPLKTPSSGAQELPTLSEMQSLPNVNLPPGSQPMPPQQYSGAPIPSFVSPSMWQESVASVYEGGIKRHWDYDDDHMVNPIAKRRV
ncbi:lipase regulator 1 protein [Rutstroemia sp. NJR-2017a BBW]|nr:lipase regulator 1 protein [Rutstroemia sp. NJR-2017a BBW]